MNIKSIKEFLIRAQKKDRVSNAYLVYGGNKNERQEVALFLSCLLNCKETPPCLKCAICKSIENRTYPDVKWIVPSKSILSIDDVRGIKETIYITPYAGEKKLYIFNIDYMRDESANALLKILEVPPVYVVLVILSRNINFFLPTIVSRCQNLRLNYVLPADTESFTDAQNEFILMLEYIRKNKLYDFFRMVDEIVKTKEKQEIEQWLEKVLYLYRRTYLEHYGVEKNLLVVTEVDHILTINNIVKVIESLLEVRERIRYNINLKLGLENLFLQINQLS